MPNSDYSIKRRNNRVLLIYTGGTIGMGENPKTGALEPLDLNHLVSCIPEFSMLNTGIETYQFMPPIDSSDMSPRLWSQLVKIISERYNSYDGFVILHGTDTMAYTASALSFMLENLTKPVILTGSQLPINQLRTDGKENLITSIEIAAAAHDDGTAIVPEVCIYFSGKLLRGNRATKTNADGFNAFETFNEEFQINKYFASIGDSKHHPYLTITFSNHSVFLLKEISFRVSMPHKFSKYSCFPSHLKLEGSNSEHDNYTPICDLTIEEGTTHSTIALTTPYAFTKKTSVI